MCGIAGIVSLSGKTIDNLEHYLSVMSNLIAHRGPDGHGCWLNSQKNAGLAHRRLSIIDLSSAAKQPMNADNKTTISFNGEIYNYIELQKELSHYWIYKSKSDTECILAAYDYYSDDFLDKLRGMFAFSIWDEKLNRLLCARDRFGIKPFYYAVVDDLFIFASEVKAILPFMPSIETDINALAEYLTFQYTIGSRTLFKGVNQLLPAHALSIEDGKIKTWRYWDVSYNLDFDHSPKYFENRLTELLDQSLDLHLRSDVEIGNYLSGGIDSSLISILSSKRTAIPSSNFHGRFVDYPGYDESQYAQSAVDVNNNRLYQIDITASDFEKHINDIIYHLDFPVAGPGAFPQYMVSMLASKHLKVILGGQGGDEIFGGYTRYLLAYFEQCIKAAIDGNYKNGNFVVTIESIIPNLGVFREYKPLIKEFWKDGLFGELDDRYFRLIDRSVDMNEEINWNELNREQVIHDFKSIFNNRKNVCKAAYFDSMTHFDFKCLLPALLHVEDRMSMAHSLESRVPLLDHPLIEFAASIPADIKFKDGNMKHLLKKTYKNVLPSDILNRRDKMGFPVPLKEWFGNRLKSWVSEALHSQKNRSLGFLNNEAILRNFQNTGQFSRKLWALLSLELWFQSFHDKSSYYRNLLNKNYCSNILEEKN